MKKLFTIPRFLSAAFALLFTGVVPMRAATLPAGFTETKLGSAISSLTAMVVAPDGRVFVCQQDGQVRVVKNGVLLPTPFATVVVENYAESGLVGVVLDPNFSANGYVYVYYTATTPTVHNRVSRFTADPANPDVALPASEQVLLELDDRGPAGIHNGGAMRFGIDGKLYIAVGDHYVSTNAQSLETLAGKVLRINADGSIPADNPFVATAAGKYRAIWALGLRNPFTFDIQRGTGRMFVNDVGNNTWEEINEVTKGSNHGWPLYEGPSVPPNPAYRDPIYAYGHGAGTTAGCAIVGGAFYNPATVRYPSQFIGKYFFGDHCNGWLRTFDPATGQTGVFATGIPYIVALEVGPDGYLYYLPRGAYAVYRIAYTGQLSPQITEHPASRIVAVGQPADFSVSASGEQPFQYQWQRNAANIAGATASTYTLGAAGLADNGAQFRCVVSNTFGSAASNAATLTVSNNRE